MPCPIYTSSLTLFSIFFQGFVLPDLLPKLNALEELIMEITASRDTSFLNYATFIEVAPHLQKFAFQVNVLATHTVILCYVVRYWSCN